MEYCPIFTLADVSQTRELNIMNYVYCKIHFLFWIYNFFKTQIQGLNCKFGWWRCTKKIIIKFPNKCSFCLLYKLLVLFVALFGGGFIFGFL